jgi:hypothetical protein
LKCISISKSNYQKEERKKEKELALLSSLAETETFLWLYKLGSSYLKNYIPCQADWRLLGQVTYPF